MAVVGVDVGGTKIAGGLVDAGGAVLAQRVAGTPRRGEALLDRVARVAARLAAEAPADDPVRAVGVGLPSMLTPDGRVLMTNHADLAGDAAGALAARIPLPVAVDNDGNLAARAEHRAGAGRGARVLVLLTVGTGIGGGVLLDGEVLRGANGGAAELGHLPVEADGPPCPGGCPGRGCLEALVSGTALAREGAALAAGDPGGALARAARAGEVDSRMVMGLAAEGDPACAALVARAGRYLGVGLAGLANVFAPDVIVVGGGLGSV
ncbi:MAG: ROK family protein, partial [Thermoleophilia bacterium]|nr:ROK family protein [Thermoleophilia bacterium]